MNNLIDINLLTKSQIEKIFSYSNSNIKKDCLKNKTIGLMFDNPSTRTRLSFVKAINDLKGNVLTCQNVGLERDHLAGHLDTIEDVRIKSSQHWSWRQECSHCPVVQLCQGACMFLKGQEFAQTCWNEYAYNMGHFKAAIKMITGQKVVKIDGKQVRPQL